LERELVRMREKGEVEVGDVRRNEREMWERENRVLMEGKSDFGKQVEYLQVELQELRGTHDDHILSRAKEKSELEQMVMEMRGEVKMRNFEVAKTEAGYEEAKVSAAHTRHTRRVNEGGARAISVQNARCLRERGSVCATPAGASIGGSRAADSPTTTRPGSHMCMAGSGEGQGAGGGALEAAVGCAPDRVCQAEGGDEGGGGEVGGHG